MPLEHLHGRQNDPRGSSPPPPYELEDSLALQRELTRPSLPSNASTARNSSFGLRARQTGAPDASVTSASSVPSAALRSSISASFGFRARQISAPDASMSSASASPSAAPRSHASPVIPTTIPASASSGPQTTVASMPAVRTREIIEILSDSDGPKPAQKRKKNKGKRKRSATPEVFEITSGSSDSDSSDLEDQVAKKSKPSAAATRVVKDKERRPNAKVYFFPGETPPDTPPATGGKTNADRSPQTGPLAFPFPLADPSELNLPPRTTARELAPFPHVPPLGIDDAPLIFDNISFLGVKNYRCA